MNIKFNNKSIEVSENETLIEIARREGIHIPSLCYAKEAKHKSSCMVCAVKNCTTGQIIPSCSTFPMEGIQIETESEEVKQVRTLSLELLLGDHRADCEAPCKMACPAGFDIAQMNRLYDAGKEEDALVFLRNELVIPATLCYICNAPCEKICRKNDIDKAVSIREIKKELVAKTILENIQKPKLNGKKIGILGSDPAGLSAAYHLQQLGYIVTVFEKATSALVPYLNTEDAPIEIIDLELNAIQQTGVEFVLSCENPSLSNFDGIVSTTCENPKSDWMILETKSKQPARLVREGQKLAMQMHLSLLSSKNKEVSEIKPFNSNYARFSETEKLRLEKEMQKTERESGCLYCDCAKKENCKLRTFATDFAIKNTRYSKNSTFEALDRQHIHGNIWFEPAKCIKCGLCVYNSDNGFTFKYRGYGMQVVLPEENKTNIKEELVELCPTGALYSIDN